MSTQELPEHVKEWVLAQSVGDVSASPTVLAAKRRLLMGDDVSSVSALVAAYEADQQNQTWEGHEICRGQFPGGCGQIVMSARERAVRAN